MTGLVFIFAPIVSVFLVLGVCWLNRDENASMLKSMRANHAIKLKADKALSMASRNRRKRFY